MKVTSKKLEQEKPFEPFELVFEVETRQDAIKLYCLFNHYCILQGLNISRFSDDVRAEIERNCSIAGYGETFQKFDKELERQLKVIGASLS